jgi:hypothetical protein
LFLQLSIYFDVELQNLEQTAGDKENFLDITNLKVRKVPGSKTRGVFGLAVFRGYIDNTNTATINIYIKQGGEYRLMPFKISSQPVCDSMKEDKYFMPEVAKVSNVTIPVPCPLTPVS